MKQKLSNILKVKKVAAVGVFYTGQQEAEYSVCLLHVKGASIAISEKRVGVLSLDEIIAFIPKNYPVVINISGKNVLNKVYPTKEGVSQTAQYVPENQKEDFYSFEYEQPETTGLSLCRKILVDQLIDGFVLPGLNVIDITIGPFPAVSLWKVGVIKTDIIQVYGLQLHIDADTGIFHLETGFKKNEPTQINLEGETIDNRLLLAYASAICWLVKYRAGSFFGQRPEGIHKDYIFKHYIAISKYPVLGLILTILLLNFMLFESYRKQEAYIETQIKLNSGIISKRDSLEITLKAKEKYLGYIGENITYFSYQLDQIAASVPSDITLEKLDINPLADKVQKTDQILFEKKIIIKGQAFNSLTLNEWSHQLAGLNWVENVNVKNFSRNNETHQGMFLLEILPKND